MAVKPNKWRKNTKVYVTYTATFEAEVDVPSGTVINDAIWDLVIPEGGENKVVYISDTFELGDVVNEEKEVVDVNAVAE